MSLRTWKAKFYPVDASETPARNALAHSLRKWRGLTAANLKKYKVYADSTAGLEDSTGVSFAVDASTCALCIHYFEDRGETMCSRCPLGYSACVSAYLEWVNTSDPQPMIQALKRAKQQQKEKG